MKNYFYALGGVVLWALIIVFPVNSHAAEWVLYDDFSSGVIDTEIWDINDSSTTISVSAGGWALFSGGRGTLTVKEAGNIKGIKADVYIESSTGSATRARVFGKVGEASNGNWLWQSSDVRLTQFSGGLSVISSDGQWIQDLIWNSQLNPTNLVATRMTISVSADRENETFTFDADGAFGWPPGTVTYNPRGSLSPYGAPTDPYWGIGTRPGSSSDSIVVYFDNVYVLTE